MAGSERRVNGQGPVPEPTPSDSSRTSAASESGERERNSAAEGDLNEEAPRPEGLADGASDEPSRASGVLVDEIPMKSGLEDAETEQWGARESVLGISGPARVDWDSDTQAPGGGSAPGGGPEGELSEAGTLHEPTSGGASSREGHEDSHSSWD